MMTNNGKISIKFLCEGLEEYKYIKKLLSFPNVFSNIYYFSEPINCKGITKIFPRYQDLFIKNLYDVILVFCDADLNSKDFQQLCSKIDDGMFGGNKVSEKVIIFGNPVTLQIVLSHIGEVNLLSSSKAKNQETILKHTGIENYKAREEQIDEMMKLIKFSSYFDMKERIDKLSSDVNMCPSTNFLCFLKKLENNDCEWIREIHELTK